LSCRRTVFIANLGTPRSADAGAVAEFLREFLSDPLVVDYPEILWRPLLHRVILRSRPRRVAHMYRSIAGDGPLPLERGTRAIVAALQEHLGDDFDVRAAYRYGTPAVGSELTVALGDAKKVAAVLKL
jgi:ferrochelatase